MINKSTVLETIISNFDEKAKFDGVDETSEYHQERELLSEIDVNSDPATVGIGSIVRLKYNKLSAFYFISPIGDSNMLRVDDTIVMVISTFSPIGHQALGKKAGEKFTVNTAHGQREYTVEEIY